MSSLTHNAVSEDRLASMIEENMGLVVLLAKSFRPRDDEERDEFVQLGRIGLWKAILKHDPRRSQLSTTAWHYIRWEILRHLQRKSSQDLQLDETIPVEDSKISLDSLWEYLPDSLSDKERTVLSLRLDGYTFVDIGNKMGFSRGWANNTYRSAVDKIQDANSEQTNTVMQ